MYDFDAVAARIREIYPNYSFSSPSERQKSDANYSLLKNKHPRWKHHFDELQAEDIPCIDPDVIELEFISQPMPETYIDELDGYKKALVDFDESDYDGKLQYKIEEIMEQA